MKELSIIKSIGSAVAMAKFSARKNSPEIWLVTGILAGAGCAVLTGIASTKVVGVIKAGKENIAVVKGERDENVLNGSVVLDPEEVTKDVARVYFRTGLQLAKLYMPAAAVGCIAIGSTLLSHKIMTKRNVAIGAALLTVTEGFKEYRQRVTDRLGEEVEHDIRYGLKNEKVDVVTVDPETGKEKKSKETIKIANDGLASDYAFYFDDSCSGWDSIPGYNKMFLEAQQSYANDRLKAHRCLFMNDVLDNLGMDKTDAGQVVGWLYDPKNPEGDNLVDFRMFETYRDVEINGVIERKKCFILDFNCDGNILKKKPFNKKK